MSAVQELHVLDWQSVNLDLPKRVIINAVAALWGKLFTNNNPFWAVVRKGHRLLEDKLRRSFSETTNDAIESLVRIGITILIPPTCNPLPAEVEAAHRFLRMGLLQKQNRRKWDVAVPLDPPTKKTGMTEEEWMKEEQIHVFRKRATSTLEGARPPAAAVPKAAPRLESPPAAAPPAAAPECDTDTEGDTELQQLPSHVTEAEKEEEEEDFRVRAGWLQIDFSEETGEEEGGFFREGGSEPDLGKKKVEEEEGGFFRAGGSEPDLGEKEEEEGGFFRAGGLEPDLGEKEEEEGFFFRAVGLVQRPKMMEVEEKDSSEMEEEVEEAFDEEDDDDAKDTTYDGDVILKQRRKRRQKDSSEMEEEVEEAFDEEDDDDAKDTTYDGDVILKQRRKRRRHWDRVERWWYNAGDGDDSDSDSDTDQSAPPTPPAPAPPTPPAATAAAPPAAKGEGKKSRKPVCPVCGEVRHKMKIHLVSKHGYPEHTAKRWWVTKPCADPENRRRPCPICHETLHLPSHLRKFHKLHPQSDEYKQALGVGLNKTKETSKQGPVACPLLEAYHTFKCGTSRKEATLEQYRNYACTLISKLAPNGTEAMLTVTDQNPQPALKVIHDLRAFFAANSLTASTMCNYVRALVDFLKFTQANPPQHFTPAKEQVLRSLLFNMKQEKDGFEKDKKRAARKGKATLRQRLPTMKINTNKFRVELDIILGKPPSQFKRGKDGVRARNLSIGLLAASNMSRGMELRSLTMEDLRSALTMPDYPDIIQFFTDHHKNEDVGPKEMFLAKNDFERIRKFTTLIRPVMLKDPLQDKDSFVFVTEHGSAIRSKQMSTIIKDTFGGVSATMFRKLVTSEFADAPAASRNNLAELAGHTTQTQDSYYTPGRTSNQRCQAMLEVADKVTGGQEEPRPTTRRRPTATITRAPTSGQASPASTPSSTPSSPHCTLPSPPSPASTPSFSPHSTQPSPPPAESEPDMCATVPLSAAAVATFGASWYQHNTKRLPESDLPKETQHRRGLRWSLKDHEVLFKYFGCWRGRDNVVGLTCRQIDQVMTHFGVKFSQTFSLQQIREKLKGWNPKKL